MKIVFDQLAKQKTFFLKSQGLSMLPILRSDDIICYEKISFNGVRINNLIMVKKHNRLFTHRVIYKSKKFLIIKGDNNPESDGKVYRKHIIGKVYQVKRDGRIFNPESLYLLQSTLYFQEVVKVKKALEREEINFIFLKGLPLHLYYEKTHPRRLYLDCDVLIDENGFLRAQKILKTLGYKKCDSSLSEKHQALKDKEVENSYYKIINGFPVVFDLHLEVVFMMTQLGKLDALYPQSLIDSLTREFLKTKQQAVVNGKKFAILNSELLIIYLALHFFHHNFHGAFRLEFLDKVIRKLHLRASSWGKIVKKIEDYKLQNFTYPVFILLKKYYHTFLPKSFLKAIKPEVNKLVFIKKNVLSINIFDDEQRIKAGINRFKNLFFLSPRPLLIRLLIFFNPQVLYSIFWVLQRRVFSFFSNRKKVP